LPREYIGRAVEHLRASDNPAPDHLLAHVAPPGWAHMSLTGDSVWREPGDGADDLLALLLRLNERLSSAWAHVHGLSSLAPSCNKP
jgi:hypothetical protein